MGNVSEMIGLRKKIQNFEIEVGIHPALKRIVRRLRQPKEFFLDAPMCE